MRGLRYACEVLSRLRVKNFRLLRDVEITFPENAPVVLVGPNASGKSTVLEVLDFLSRCATDGLERAVAAHGGISSMMSQTDGPGAVLEIETEWRFGVRGARGEVVQWELTWAFAAIRGKSGQTLVISESLRQRVDGEEAVVVSTANTRARFVHPSGGAGDPAEVPVVTKLALEVFADPRRFPGLTELVLVLSSTFVLGALPTSPAWGRDGSQEPSPRDTLLLAPRAQLSRQGIGLATMLYNLQAEHAGEWEQLDRAFRGEFPFVGRIVFPADAGGSKISFAIEDKRFPGRKIFATEMSDGMVAYLCLLAAVLNPLQLAVLGLDEPDSHLHPSALRRFMSLVHRPHPKRNIILVTHSNALLDEIADPAASVRIVEAGANGTTIRQLDPAALEAWRGDYSLSAMRQTGLLDRANTDVAEAE